MDILNNWAKKKNEELNQESYLKLRKMVCDESTVNATPERGWQFYAQEKINENPWLKKYTNVRELGEFYQTFNGGGQPLRNGKIREPVFQNPKTGLCE
jgi:hypothetical protein